MNTSYRTPAAVTVPGLWLTMFSATLAAVLVGGLILGVGVRGYLRWSVQDAARQVEDKKNPAFK